MKIELIINADVELIYRSGMLIIANNKQSVCVDDGGPGASLDIIVVGVFTAFYVTDNSTGFDKFLEMS